MEKAWNRGYTICTSQFPHVCPQVLLLEENGYLSYVDGLTEEKVYAPQLRDQFEYGDLFLTAIQEMQWDFVDAMLFLDSSTQRLSPQVWLLCVCTLSLSLSLCHSIAYSRSKFRSCLD